MSNTNTTTFHVGNRRLLKLAAFLRTVPRKQFDYGVWVGSDWGGKPDLSCGTSACALGWATTIRSFRRAGLYMRKKLYNAGGYPAIKGQEKDLWSPYDVASKLFGITYEDACSLFLPSSDAEYKATPEQVAQKIERFVAKRQKAQAAK